MKAERRARLTDVGDPLILLRLAVLRVLLLLVRLPVRLRHGAVFIRVANGSLLFRQPGRGVLEGAESSQPFDTTSSP